MREGDAMARRGSEMLPDSRRALLGVYVALDDRRPRDPSAPDVSLRGNLARLGITFPADLDPYDALVEVAAQRQDTAADIPRVQLAEAAMRLLEVPDIPRRDIGPLLQALAAEDVKDADTTPILQALDVTRRQRGRERTKTLRDVGGRSLHRDLLRVSIPRISTELRYDDGEYVSRVETAFEVLDPESVGLDTVASRMFPADWPAYNSFFCAMNLFEARYGDLSATAPAWRAVFHEQVGDCPADWFPNTYLLFTWARADSQLVLNYELASPPAGARPTILIDEGYIQIDQLPGRYEVSTVKHLLFDDRLFPDGGVSLAEYAPLFGWLDQAINWFVPKEPGTFVQHPAPSKPGQDAHLQEVIDDYESDLRQTLKKTDAQLRAAVQRCTEGTYGFDAYLTDWARATERAIGFGARSVQRQVEFARRAAKLVGVLTGKGPVR